MRVRKKPVEVEAFQWSPRLGVGNGVMFNVGAGYHIPTLEGGMHVKSGDWVITGVKGEKYPCDDTIFRETYDLLEPEWPAAVIIRPTLHLQAFQWSGAEMVGYRRIEVGGGPAGEKYYNLVVTREDGREEFAVPGDWIICGAKDCWVWTEDQFAATYEVVE